MTLMLSLDMEGGRLVVGPQYVTNTRDFTTLEEIENNVTEVVQKDVMYNGTVYEVDVYVVESAGKMYFARLGDFTND